MTSFIMPLVFIGFFLLYLESGVIIMAEVNALILAGDSGKGEFGPNVTNKSFIEIHGKWIVEYVVDALRESGKVGCISIVGSIEKLKVRLEGKVDHFIQEDADLFENLQKGLAPFDGDRFVLVATSDIPMINGTVVSDFIERCKTQNVDLCYPVVEKGINDSLYPGFKRTYVKLKDGTFTGGNIIGLNPRVLGPCAEFAKGFITHRKKPWELGRLLGPRFLVLLATGNLSISHVEKRFRELLGIKARAIISPYPEIANDIDKPSDVELANQYI